MNKKLVVCLGVAITSSLSLRLYLKKGINMIRKSDDVTSRFVVPDFESAAVVSKDSPKHKMDNIERDALIDVAKAMDDEEIDIFLDNISIERVMMRLEREIEKNKIFREAIEAAVPV